MTSSRADAESLRGAIQELLFAARHHPVSMAERQEVNAAWNALERLTNAPILVPGEDAAAWTFRLRGAAWKVYGYAAAPTGPLPIEAMTHIKHCQDTLRVVPMPGVEATPAASEGKRRGSPRGAGAAENDASIFDAWQSGEYKQYIDLAEAIGVTAKEIRRVLDRERKRRQRAGQ